MNSSPGTDVDLLLDTHVLLGLTIGSTRVVRRLSHVIDDPTSSISISAITYLEVAIKHSLGKLDIDVTTVRHAALDNGFLELPLAPGHAEQLALLPLHHRDPFDRALIAQAMSEEMTLASADRAFTQYEGLALLTV